MELDVSWNRMVSSRRARLVSWMRAVGSKASLARAEAWLGEQPSYLDLAARWDGLGARERDEAWHELIALYRAAAYSTRPHCIRCGTCCENAGPTLYAGDEGLLRDRQLSPAQLRTYRKGEEVFSHWANRPTVLEQECVMVAPAAGGGCSLFVPADKGCRIYQRRPTQCDAQKCWDTVDANELMGSPGLTRLELLGDGHPLATAVAAHEEACPVVGLRAAAARYGDGDEEGRAEVVAMIERDRDVRSELLVSKQASQASMLFFLGRPLETLLPTMGYQVASGWDRGLRLEPVPR
jgi:Fe-S-cluster containining protein